MQKNWELLLQKNCRSAAKWNTKSLACRKTTKKNREKSGWWELVLEMWGFFTMKGAQVLEQADVVVYDSLVGQGILTRIPASAKLINVGKRAGHHTMSQEKINQVLADEAKKGNRVVRLKGGDPFLFGRGGEELELLTRRAFLMK